MKMKLPLIRYTTNNTIRKTLFSTIIAMLVVIGTLSIFKYNYQILGYPLLILVVLFLIHSLLTKHYVEIGILSFESREIVIIRGDTLTKYPLFNDCSALLFYGGYKGLAFFGDMFLRGSGFKSGDQNFIILSYDTGFVKLQFKLNDKLEYYNLKKTIDSYKMTGIDIKIRIDLFGIQKKQHLKKVGKVSHEQMLLNEKY